MLTIAPLKKASDATSYYARDNYYTKEDGVEFSWWQGQGASELGLSGNVDADDFERLLTGKINDDIQLGKITKKGAEHRPGWDFTFSAPKSLSLLSEVYGVELLRDAHEEAVKKAISEGEKRFARARIQVAGKSSYEQTNSVIVAAFTHDVSRELEPQIHTHTIHLNATHSSVGWRSLSPELFFKQQHQFSRIYKNELARRVKSLGFQLRPSRFDATLFEIEGVSDGLIEYHSTRSTQIRSFLDRQGIEYNSRDAKIASLLTRKKKQTVARDELRRVWRERSDEFLQSHPGLSVSVAKLVNALQNEKDFSIEVSDDVFQSPEEPIKKYYDGESNFETSVHETENHAMDSLADQFIDRPQHHMVIAKDEIQKMVLDETIRKKMINKGQLGTHPEYWEGRKRVFLSKHEQAQTHHYRTGDLISFGNQLHRVIAIKNNEGLIVEKSNGERTRLNINKIPKNAIFLRHHFLELRRGDKIRFTTSHSNYGIRKGDVAIVESVGDELAIQMKGSIINIESKTVAFEYAYSRVEKATHKIGKPVLNYLNPNDNIFNHLKSVRKINKPNKTFVSLDTEQRINAIQKRQAVLDAIRPIRQAIRHLQEREMAISQDDIVKTAKLFQKLEIKNSDLVNEVERLIDKRFLWPAPGHPDRPGEQLWTTQKAIMKEDTLARCIESGKTLQKPIARAIDVDIDLKRSNLNDIQKGAVIKALTSPDQFFAIQGDPGVGKTTTLKELRTLLNRRNVEVYGFAPSHQAVKELSSSIKVKGYTVDRFLVDSKIQSKIKGRKSLWLIDEAGLLTTEKINRMMTSAKEKNARVIFVGDQQQLESVGAGRGFAQMLEEGIDCAFMDKRLRQKTELTRTVVDDVMKKDYASAINKLTSADKMTKAKSEIAAIESLVSDWTKLLPEDRKETFIVAPTNQQRELIDYRIRVQLKAEGTIKQKDQSIKSLTDRYLTEQQKRIAGQYKVGDIIRFNKGYENVHGLLGKKIKRDDYFRVAGINKQTNKLVIRHLTNGRTTAINPLHIAADRPGAASVYAASDVQLSIGDKVRWTDNRGHLGIEKNAEGIVADIGSDYVRIHSNNKSVKINRKDWKDAHLSHNYSKTVYNVQGATSQRVLALMEGWRRNTTHQRSFMVALTRASHDIRIYTSSDALDQEVKKRTANNTRARETSLVRPII